MSTPGRRQLSRREVVYFSLRGGATALFLLSAVVLPRGPVAGLLCLGAGLVAVLTCLGTNAGGPGEQAGARFEAQRREPRRPPQGDWPPFDPSRIVEGEVEAEGKWAPRPRRG